MLLFHALFSGPNAQKVSVLVLWMLGGGVILLSVLTAVAVRDPAALAPTATAEIGVVGTGLGVILGHIFK